MWVILKGLTRLRMVSAEFILREDGVAVPFRVQTARTDAFFAWKNSPSTVPAVQGNPSMRLNAKVLKRSWKIRRMA